MILLAKFAKLFVKYWPAFILVGLILYAGWTYHSMRMEIAKLESALFEAAVEIEEVKNERNEAINNIERQNQALVNLYDKNRKYELEIEKLKMARPERLTEYRDVIKTVEREIVSPECVNAIKEAAKLLKDLRDEG